ncbi:MAG: hypothetical protein EAZ44_03920 [Cytophagia bacterium]|nr:MAG: hypothetical protein EAZ44_03920 [Cytophagia bacterium]TAG43769.1 MAG: hypothetical protein EAZ31_03685 [Cytophagia bacterium]
MKKVFVFLFIFVLVFGCQQKNEVAPKKTKRTIMMTAIEFKNLVDSGKLVDSFSQIRRTKNCSGGEYWVKTGDRVVYLGGRAYRQVEYEAYDCELGYLESGVILTLIK